MKRLAKLGQHPFVQKFIGCALWWSGFKVGALCGGVLMALYMAVLFTIPGVAHAVMGAVR